LANADRVYQFLFGFELAVFVAVSMQAPRVGHDASGALSVYSVDRDYVRVNLHASALHTAAGYGFNFEGGFDCVALHDFYYSALI
jgi:hypothetical protein